MTGSGTLLDPYVIWDVDDLQDMNFDLTAYYELGQNIDALPAKWGWASQIRRPTGDFFSAGAWNVFPAAPATKWDKIDEVVADGDATYIEGVTNGADADFTFPAFAVPATAENIGLKLTAIVRNDGTGTSRLRFRLRVNGVNYVKLKSSFTSSAYVQFKGVWNENPDTGLPWTVNDINGVGPSPLQAIGVEAFDATPDLRITQFYATAFSMGFEPIGQDTGAPADRFSGYFDGKEFTISNLLINRPEGYKCVGLFGINQIWTSGYLRNVGLENVDITGEGNVGSLIGFAEYMTLLADGIISDVWATGIVRGEDVLIGGFTGYNGSLIQDCWTSCEVIILGEVTHARQNGGFVGLNDRVIRRCYATGNITVNHQTGRDIEEIGGFVGYHNNQEIDQCFSTGDVLINDDGMALDDVWAIGGFCGDNWGNGIRNCYARGNVTVTAGTGIAEDVGGLCGWSESPVVNCYSTGSVSAPGFATVGGLVGQNWGSVVTDSFWDTNTSGMLISDGGTGLPTAQMKDSDTFITAGWGFGAEWGMTGVCNDGYPCLLGVTPSCAWAPVVPPPPYRVNRAYALAREEL
ncbi:hypothetical protein ES703_00335 [subsurface metagenome]